MKIINANVELMTEINGDIILRKLEEIGRVCYKSEGGTTEESHSDFIRMIMRRHHESVIEHCSFTARFICDRGVSHEIVRHRLASYSQESTRYCNYSKEKFGGEITVIMPATLKPGTQAYKLWEDACYDAEQYYLAMIYAGASAQEARDVLPHSVKTEVIMTANLREWRHFFAMRTSEAAHPQMRILARRLLDTVRELVPVIFDDIRDA